MTLIYATSITNYVTKELQPNETMKLETKPLI